MTKASQTRILIAKNLPTMTASVKIRPITEFGHCRRPIQSDSLIFEHYPNHLVVSNFNFRLTAHRKLNQRIANSQCRRQQIKYMNILIKNQWMLRQNVSKL